MAAKRPARSSKPAKQAAARRKGETAAVTPASGSHDRLPAACRIEEDIIHLRGTPGEMVGIASVQHSEEPDETAFKLLTTDISQTRFGYEQSKRFAPFLSSSLPFVGHATRQLTLARLPPPGGSGRVPVTLSLDPHTPPGTYDAVFALAGQEQRAKLEVLEVERLSFSPRSVSIVAAPGEVVKVRLVISNEGNTEIALGVLGMLVLQEEEQVCLSLQRALADVKASDDGEEHRVFLNSLARSLAEKKTDFGRVRLAEKNVTLRGGESYAGEVEIHTPRDMVPGAQYRSLLKARSGQLFVSITARERAGKAA